MPRLVARLSAFAGAGLIAALALVPASACDPAPDKFDAATDAVATTTADVTTIVEASQADSADPRCAGVSCPSHMTCCAGSCVDTSVNTSSCGACNVACPSTTQTAGSTCTAGTCRALQPVRDWSANVLDFLVLSGSVLYSAASTPPEVDAGGNCGTVLEWNDLSGPTSNVHVPGVFPTLAPVPDGRGGVYEFESCPDPLLSHFTPPATSAVVLEHEGATAQPHVIVRQGDSVARITTPDAGTLRVACSNGVTHDIVRGGGIAYAAADDDAVYFGVGSDVTPAFKVPCDDPATPVTSLPNVYGYVAYVDAKNVYWFGTPPSEDAAAKIDSFYASSKDGTGAPRFILTPPPTIDLLSFPLLDGDLLYFTYRARADQSDVKGTNILARTSIANPARQDLLASTGPIALDPAFAYTVLATDIGTSMVYRVPLR
jgi:hypothetical protein